MSKCLGLLDISYPLLKWVADDKFFYIQIALQALGLHSTDWDFIATAAFLVQILLLRSCYETRFPYT
jgi:hypothetical protein